MKPLRVVGTVLVPGAAEGSLLRLERPLSLWGGVDPRSGDIIDPRHPQYGETMRGRIVAIERIIGSSSGSSVLLELISIGKGPAGLILVEADAIAALGVIVAREMGYGSLPVVQVDAEMLAGLPTQVRIDPDGDIQGAAAEVEDLASS